MLPKPDDFPDEPVRVVKLDFPVGEIYEVAFWRRFNVIDFEEATLLRWITAVLCQTDLDTIPTQNNCFARGVSS